MRLVDLNPRFLGGAPDREGVGIEFDCPCGGICGHSLFVPFENPLDGGAQYGPTGWKRAGDTFETLTLTPSILRLAPSQCGWHGFVTNGEIITV